MEAGEAGAVREEKWRLRSERSRNYARHPMVPNAQGAKKRADICDGLFNLNLKILGVLSPSSTRAPTMQV